MATLRIPSPLRPYAGGQAQIEVSSTDVAGALHELITAHPDLKKHLFNEQGELRQFVNIFLNDENVRDLQGLQTAVKASDALMILPSIAGGRQPGAPPARKPGAVRHVWYKRDTP